ncbi:MAG: N-acetyl-gamma-glutamyl-phosphate reductase [Arenicella sp.]
MIKVGIIGGTGYTGVELLRLLAVHPEVAIEVITSRSESGRLVADLYPNLRGHLDIAFTEPNLNALKACDVVFSATPNGVLMKYARELHNAGVKLIDLAADFRIKDIRTWEQWYGMSHECPELVEKAVYGMPEMNRQEIRSASLVANPGCYVTATTLALLPLVGSAESGAAIDLNGIVVDAKSGVTGAGRGASVATLYSEVTDSFKAYGVAGHRHHPEITQNLSVTAGEDVGITFVPHLVPMQRGILSTIYVDPVEGVDIQALYNGYYENEKFVDVLPQGVVPDTRSVRSSNMCRIAFCQPKVGNKLVILSVIDNLTKGAAGQAVQNFNIMFGFDEATALSAPALMP